MKNLSKFIVIAFIAIVALVAAVIIAMIPAGLISLAAGADAFAALVVLFAFIGIAKFVLGYLGINYLGKGWALSALDITELNTALGAYFRKDKDILISEMLTGMNIDDRFDTMDDCKDEVPLTKLNVTDIVQPANDVTFSGTSNALKFGARILKVRRWKVDLLLVPGQLEKSWLGKYKKKGSDAYDLPFEQYIMNYIRKRAQNNIRLRAHYKGVYNASGTAPIDIMDGLLTLIETEVAAGQITPITTGALTSSNIIDSVELVFDGLGDEYKEVETIMLCSPTNFMKYTRKYRSLYGANNDYDGMTNQGSVPIDGTMCKLKREPGLTGMDALVCTLVENLKYGVDSLGEESDIKSQVFERTIKLMIDAKSGVQISDLGTQDSLTDPNDFNRAIAVNDQTAVSSS